MEARFGGAAVERCAALVEGAGAACGVRRAACETQRREGL